MHVTFRRALAAAATVLALASCAAPIGPHVARPTIAVPPGSVPPSALAPTGVQVDLGPAPADLHRVDWARLPLPGSYCGVSDLTVNGGTATSSTWGQVALTIGVVDYGDVTGDGRPDAAIASVCAPAQPPNAEADAAARIVIAADHGRLTVIGIVTPRKQPADVPLTYFDHLVLTAGRVTAYEVWYRPDDATCCASGRATTVWILRDGYLQPLHTDVTA